MGQHVPAIFTEPLRRTLAAMQAKDSAGALSEVVLLSRIILQYSFSSVAASLEVYDRLSLPKWGEPGSLSTLESKVQLLPGLLDEFNEVEDEERTLTKLQPVVQHTVEHLAQFKALGHFPGVPHAASRAEQVVQGLAVIRPWLEKALPFCNQAEHYLEGPDSDGQVFGVIQFGDISLELEQPQLRILHKNYRAGACRRSPGCPHPGRGGGGPSPACQNQPDRQGRGSQSPGIPQVPSGRANKKKLTKPARQLFSWCNTLPACRRSISSRSRKSCRPRALSFSTRTPNSKRALNCCAFFSQRRSLRKARSWSRSSSWTENLALTRSGFWERPVRSRL